MYGFYLRWERNGDDSWFFVIGTERVDGFWAESAAIRAGFKRLRELEKKKMEELEMELRDVERSIKELVLAPQHIGENVMGDWGLEDLQSRQHELKELLEHPVL